MDHQETIMATILAETAPSLDDDIRDYLLQGVLADADSLEDLNALEETLHGFIDDENVLERVMSAIRRLAVTSNGRATSCETDAKSLNGSNDHVRLLHAPQSLKNISGPTAESTDTHGPVEIEEDDASNASLPVQPPVSARPSRKERRRPKPPPKRQSAREQSDDDDQGSDHDEHVVAAQERWGGRGKGGRGEYAAATNSIKSNIHLSSVSILLDNGLDLLTGSPMDIIKGHRYGLIGRNGVGK